jgi:hypothetical protein
LVVLHLGPDGSVVSETDGFLAATDVWADPTDGTCWVSDLTARDTVQQPILGRLVHLAADGTRLSQTGGFGVWFTTGSAISGTDSTGAIWVADAWHAQVVRLRPWFYDVPRSHWAFRAILACVEAGIIAGYPSGLYIPDGEVTRDQMAVYIARSLAGGDEHVPDPSCDPTFSDVPADHWGYRHVEYVVASNVVAGYSDGLYHCAYTVDRAQMAVYMARSIAEPIGEEGLIDYTPADPRNFPDVPESHWAYTHIEYCVEHEVVQGHVDGLYHPAYSVTRDQMTVYIARAFDLIGS